MNDCDEMKSRLSKISLILVSVCLLVSWGIGEFIFWRVLEVSCTNPTKIENNHPKRFLPDGVNQGPFRGERWNKWATTDLSKWFLENIAVEDVVIESSVGNLELSAWWYGANYPKEQRTVIVIHGIGSSKKHYNQLIPANILAKAGLNVIIFDQRNHGDSSCPSGKYYAGTKEWKDIETVISWLTKEKLIPVDKIGIHAVSGGTLAAQFLMAERDDIKAFSLDSPVFDFEAIVKSELTWNGIPSVFWRLAVITGKLHGIDIYEKKPKDGIDKLNNRPLLIFHGTEDTRVPFSHSQKLVAYAKKIGQEVTLIENKKADHNEALLIEPEVFEKILPDFFKVHLK